MTKVNNTTKRSEQQTYTSKWRPSNSLNFNCKRCKDTDEENLYVDHTLEDVYWTDAVDDVGSVQTPPPVGDWC